jgi:RNA polymerase sigma-70 factor (ECF subfamily)
MTDDLALELEALYRSGYGRFCNTLVTVTGSRELAREAVQEAFAQALASRARFRREGSLEAWVWTIAVRQGARLRARSQALPRDSQGSTGEPERDPELAAAVRALPPRRRLIVFLRYFGGLSYAEIAAVCGISEGTVGATLAKAHDALRKELCGRAYAGGRT